MKNLLRKSMSLAMVLIMMISVASVNAYAEGIKKIQIDLPSFESAKFKEANDVEMYSDTKDVSNLLNIKADSEGTNELNVTSAKFGPGGVLGYDIKQYLEQAMEIWIPDTSSDEDKQKLVEQGITNGVEQDKYANDQLKEACKKWDGMDWDLDNSYYQLKVKLPKNMTFDREKFISKWNLDIKGENNDDFLASLYEPQKPDVQGNTIIFKAKFKTLKSDIALNLKPINSKPNSWISDDSKNWNKQILKISLPVDIHYKKDTNAFEYAVDLEHSIKIADKKGEVLLEGLTDNALDILHGPLLPMDMSKANIEAFPLKQQLDGDMAVGDNSESEALYSFDKDKVFDLTTKLNVTPIKSVVGDPLGTLSGSMPGGKKFADMQTFKFWPALYLGSEFSTTLRFPQEIIVPEDIKVESLELLGAKEIFAISKLEKTVDPVTKETLLKVYMPLTDNAKKSMPSLHALSKLISSVDDNLYLKVKGLKLSSGTEYDKHYTIEGAVSGKVFFTFITDVDDWVANEYKDELQEKFGNDIVKKDDTWNVLHFNGDSTKLEEAVDYMLVKHPEIFNEVVPMLLKDAGARRKYDTNVYSLFVNWIGKQEEGGRDYVYSLQGGDPEDITFTLIPKKTIVPEPGPYIPYEPDKPDKPTVIEEPIKPEVPDIIETPKVPKITITPKVETKPDIPKTNAKNNPNPIVPKTGGDNSEMLYVLLMLVSGSAIFVIRCKDRKNTK